MLGLRSSVGKSGDAKDSRSRNTWIAWRDASSIDAKESKLPCSRASATPLACAASCLIRSSSSIDDFLLKIEKAAAACYSISKQRYRTFVSRAVITWSLVVEMDLKLQ